MKNTTNCIGFPPCIDSNCTLLILGSMPGVTSLAQQQYYAHPQNRFWPLMARLLENTDPPTSYEERLSMLLRHHIALWDSIDTCHRNGSLDTAIRDAASNDFAAFFQQYPFLHTICFNGAKSAQIFKKYNKALLNAPAHRFLSLPSTSPANARWSFTMLLKKWQTILASTTQNQN